MILVFSNSFKKTYSKFSLKIQNQIDLRIKLFVQEPNNPQLNTHRLKGEYEDYFSINISGDIRAMYEIVDKDTILFIKIGTHSELY